MIVPKTASGPMFASNQQRCANNKEKNAQQHVLFDGSCQETESCPVQGACGEKPYPPILVALPSEIGTNSTTGKGNGTRLLKTSATHFKNGCAKERSSSTCASAQRSTPRQSTIHSAGDVGAHSPHPPPRPHHHHPVHQVGSDLVQGGWELTQPLISTSSSQVSCSV